MADKTQGAPQPSGQRPPFSPVIALLTVSAVWDARLNAALKDLGLTTRKYGLLAHVQATPGTGLIGENWRVRDGKVETITATPQLWEHALFYLASLEVYGRR